MSEREKQDKEQTPELMCQVSGLRCVGVELIFISKIKVSKMDPVACIQELKYENPTIRTTCNLCVMEYGH